MDRGICIGRAVSVGWSGISSSSIVDILFFSLLFLRFLAVLYTMVELESSIMRGGCG